MVEIVTTLKEADEVLKRLKSAKDIKGSNFKKINLIEPDYFASISFHNLNH